jgi:hypothetical protein
VCPLALYKDSNAIRIRLLASVKVHFSTGWLMYIMSSAIGALSHFVHQLQMKIKRKNVKQANKQGACQFAKKLCWCGLLGAFPFKIYYICFYLVSDFHYNY